MDVSDCTGTWGRNRNQEVLRERHFEVVLISLSLVLFSTGKIQTCCLHLRTENFGTLN